MQNLEIYLNETILDQRGLPLVILDINGRKAVFAKQLANIFEGSKTSSDLMLQLRKTGGYSEDEGWQKLSHGELKEISAWEKTMAGKSAVESLLAPFNSNGAAIIYEEGALWLLARSNAPRGREFAKLLVKTFIDVRDGHFIAPEGAERLRERLQYTEAEKSLRSNVFDRGFTQIAYFVMEGDKAFYDGRSTQHVRSKKGIPEGRALADFDTSIELTAKTLAKKTTDKNILDKDIRHHQSILSEYVKNNKIMRESLVQMGIIPEDLPIEEDIRLLKKRSQEQLKAAQGQIKKLR